MARNAGRRRARGTHRNVKVEATAWTVVLAFAFDL
jgi:hypothetical protein